VALVLSRQRETLPGLPGIRAGPALADLRSLQTELQDLKQLVAERPTESCEDAAASADNDDSQLVETQHELSELRSSFDDQVQALRAAKQVAAGAKKALAKARADLDAVRGNVDKPQGEARGGAKSPRASPWLAIGIPTVPRRDGLDYLNPALDYILEQLPDHAGSSGGLLLDRVRVLVLNNGHGAAHPALDKARKRLDPRSNPMGRYVVFAENEEPLTHGKAADLGAPNVPGARVRQQTVDMASLIEASAALRPSLFFLMEDDFRLCPHFFQVLDYALGKVSRVDPRWIALRISYGLAGAVVPQRDMRPLAAYLRANVQRRPPDHLLVEWFAGETPESRAYKDGRAHFAFRFNLLQHFGTVSSLRGAKQGRYAGCYEALDEGSLFEVEVFKPRECPDEDVWPCPPASWTEAHPPLGLGMLGDRVYRVDHGGGPVQGTLPTDKVRVFAGDAA